MNRTFIDGVKSLLKIPQIITIVAHRNPDGDAIGSSLALYHYLRLKGHQVFVVFPNQYPDFFNWMPNQEKIILFENNIDKAKSCIEKSQVIFTLDFNALFRVGDVMEVALKESNADFVMIDHHEKPDDYAIFQYSDTKMGSTCQMVYHFIEGMEGGNLINKDIANCLYVGIMTDSGCFRFPRTTAITHRVIADLIEKGAENNSIHELIYDQNSFYRVKLLGFLLNEMVWLKEYKTTYITLSADTMKKYNFKKGDAEGVVNFGLSVKGVSFAAFFSEETKGKSIATKVSLRSRGDFDVNLFARKYFNGGGHKNAAGGKIEESLSDAVLRLKKSLEKEMKILENI